MSEAKDLRSYQREASEAARSESKSEDERFVADLMAERDRRIWSEASLESERKFGSRAARLYPLIGAEGGIKTPLGQGTLFTVFESGCQVSLMRGGNTGRDANGKPYKPLREFAVEEIEPYRGGRG